MSEIKTSTAIPSGEKNEIEIDVSAMLAELLLKWKTILAFLLIGAILGACLSVYLGKVQDKPVTDEEIAKARGILATDRADEVDQLFFQYVGYKEYREDLSEYYQIFASATLDRDSVIRISGRYLVTSTIENLGTFLPDLVMTENEFQALREIVPDEEWGSRIYDRVGISSVSNSPITVTNLEGNSSTPTNYIFTVTLFGTSEEQCREELAIVDKALHREIDSIRELLDPDISMQYAGDDINYNMFSYISDQRKASIDHLSVGEHYVKSVDTKAKDLPDEEKAYYDLLLRRYNEQFAVKTPLSWKKWTVVFAFLGAVLSVILILLVYLFDGKMKSSCELDQGNLMLYRVFIKGKKNLFGKWASSLVHADGTDPAEKAKIVSTDLAILLDKNGKSSLFMFCCKQDADARSFAEQVKALMLEKNGALHVEIADPLDSARELEFAAQSDLSVVFAEVKKTKRSTLLEWDRICARYMLPSLGSVSVQRCW